MSLFSNSVDSILGDISRKIDALIQVAEAKEREAEVHAEEIVRRTTLASAARGEIARAKTVASKLKELISA